MYLQYWGFATPPFGNAPDARLFYPSPQHEEALFRLMFAVEQRKGVAMLTGEVGAGKTTVSRSFMERVRRGDAEIFSITNPALSPEDFIRAILISFGDAVDPGATKSIMLKRISDHLARSAAAGLKSVLVVDEAHTVDNPATFEEMRMLLNMLGDGQFLLTLILMGQPPLANKIARLQPLRERIAIHYHLEPLDFPNTLRYLLFRLKTARAGRGIFTREAVQVIYAQSGGIPLKINRVCDYCLLLGMTRRLRVIGRSIVFDAIEEMRIGDQ